MQSVSLHPGPRQLCRRHLHMALLLVAAPLFFGGCKAPRDHLAGGADGDRPPALETLSWDRVAFAAQLVRDEYGEQIEDGDFSGVPQLAAVLHGALESMGGVTDQTRTVAAALGEVRASVLHHAGPRVVRRMCARLLTDLSKAGRLVRRPSAPPDLRRGASAYAIACAACHGPPNGPPPPTAAHMSPRPPPANASAVTPYELFNRITYGGAGTPMPSFSAALPERARWDIAFYLFASDGSPARRCHFRPWPLPISPT